MWAYVEADADPPGAADWAVYERMASDQESRRTLERLRVSPRSGRAWQVRAGQVCRITAVEGPQVGDFNCWNLHNPRERFWAARTRQLQRAHVTTRDRLWSTLPYLRPMLTIINDTVAYGEDADGGRCHDLLGTRCDPYVTQLLDGRSFDFHCHSNLTRAVLPFGLGERDVHDVLNVFQVTALHDDRYHMKPCPARQGDHLEFLAEIDLLCALSACPGGDLVEPLWGNGGTSTRPGHPLGVEVYELDDVLLRDWRPPEPVHYEGLHGLGLPEDRDREEGASCQ